MFHAAVILGKWERWPSLSPGMHLPVTNEASELELLVIKRSHHVAGLDQSDNFRCHPLTELSDDLT